MKEKRFITAEEWKKKSEEGDVCGILGCKSKPTTFCSHCHNWYCDDHKFVIGLPGHPIEEIKIDKISSEDIEILKER